MFLSCFSLMYAPITIATKASDRLWPDLGVILEDGGKGTDLRGFGASEFWALWVHWLDFFEAAGGERKMCPRSGLGDAPPKIHSSTGSRMCHDTSSMPTPHQPPPRHNLARGFHGLTTSKALSLNVSVPHARHSSSDSVDDCQILNAILHVGNLMQHCSRCNGPCGEPSDNHRLTQAWAYWEPIGYIRLKALNILGKTNPA